MVQAKFINHTDPTQPVDTSLVPLESQYSALTEHDKLLLWCKVNNYDRIPPSIEQFWSDSYYLGGTDFFDGGSNIYQFWKDNLPKIFPSPVLTAKPYLILSGAIGIGKSTVSKICLAYTYCRMLCMKNPSKTLHLAPKPFSAVIYHRDEKVAYKEFRNWFVYSALEKCPFFHNTKPKFEFNILTAGPMSAVGLGSDVIVYILSEVNFYPNPQRAQGIVETAYGRFTSRFDRDSITKVGNLIIDSSAKGDNSCTEWFKDNAPSDLTWDCKPTHFEVKPDSYKESEGKTFSVYTGDGKYPAQILSGDYKLGDDQDPERILKVPIQLMPEAKLNLTKFLQDKCGISTSISDAFFNGSVEHLGKCFKTRNFVPEILTVDFFDRTDSLYDKLLPAIDQIPSRSSIWIGLDLATTDDYTGLACVCFDSWEFIGSAKMPRIKCYFSVAIARKEGQETSLTHIFDLLMRLQKDFNVIVSADQAYSKQLLQDCERENIKTNGRISTDLVPCEPALYLKNLILQGLIEIPENRRLLREAYDLKYIPTSKGYKIDHPKKATQNPVLYDRNDGRGSKDVWDALSSAVYSLKMSINDNEESGYTNGVDKQLQVMTELTKGDELQRRVQGWLDSMFDY